MKLRFKRRDSGEDVLGYDLLVDECGAVYEAGEDEDSDGCLVKSLEKRPDLVVAVIPDQPMSLVQIHNEDCWQKHPGCALAKVVRLKAEVARLRPDAEAYQKVLADVRELALYVEHGSWRCEQYKKCHCGLDELMEKLGLDGTAR